MLLSLALSCSGAPPEARDTPVAVDSAHGDTAGPPAAVALDAPPQNLVMISIDTLRRDRVGRYDPDADALGSATPFLDELLDAGVALERLRSCSNWTYPATVCALSGQRPVAVGFVPFVDSDELLPDLPGDVPWLAERLRTEGFATALVSSNHVLSGTYATNRGYDETRHLQDGTVGWVTAETLSALDALSGADRWFLHAHLVDPHNPYDPPPEYRPDGEPPDLGVEDPASFLGMHELADRWSTLSDAEQQAAIDWVDGLYRAELRAMDDGLRLLHEELSARGALDDALVVVWSDHGEQFWERGNVTHGEDLYREEIDAIAAFLAPGLAPAPWTGPTALSDLRPTILDALGLSPDPDPGGAIVGTASAARSRFATIYDADHVQQSVVLGDQALLYRWTGALERYDLSQDPGETQDLYAPGDPEAELLWDLLAPEVEALQALFPERDRVAP